MSETIKLHGCAQDDLQLKEALEFCLPALEGRETVALLYTPGNCLLALLKDKTLRDNRDQEVALAEVFEARIFNEQVELRWLHKSNRRGRAVLLSGGEIPRECSEKLPKDVSLSALKTLLQTYLLWGEMVVPDNHAPWYRLTTARIGKLDVPLQNADRSKLSEEINKGEKKRVQLKALEYLAEYDADGNVVQEDNNSDKTKLHGNVAVVEERLLKLEVA